MQQFVPGNRDVSDLVLQRLSSGLRVNSARDDAAGLAIAERMNSQVRGMHVAIRNANDGISLAQTAEGALGKLADMLQRMRELAVQSANATNGPSDRSNLDAEYQQLSQEITRTMAGTRFNGLAILAGSAGSLTFQVGPGTSTNDQVTVGTSNLASNALVTAVTGGGISTTATAQTAARVAASMPGAGASSMTFWWRRCSEQSRSKR